MGPTEVRAFLTHLAVNRTVSASAQNQALNAIVFMYREVVRRDLGEFGEFDRARCHAWPASGQACRATLGMRSRPSDTAKPLGHSF
jgi:hypothetical protein